MGSPEDERNADRTDGGIGIKTLQCLRPAVQKRYGPILIPQDESAYRDRVALGSDAVPAMSLFGHK